MARPRSGSPSRTPFRTARPALALACALAAAAVVLATAPRPALAQAADVLPDTNRVRDRLRPGSWEFTLGFSFSNYSGTSTGYGEVRAGTFRRAGSGLVGLETLVSYNRVSNMNIADAQLGLSWQKPIHPALLARNRATLYPYVGIAGGVSQAWEGPFEDTRYPVGFNIGLRSVQSKNSALRVEYRWRTYLDSVEGNFEQSGWFVGYSFLFRNEDRPR